MVRASMVFSLGAEVVSTDVNVSILVDGCNQAIEPAKRDGSALEV
jgi:hypothetical protein